MSEAIKKAKQEEALEDKIESYIGTWGEWGAYYVLIQQIVDLKIRLSYLEDDYDG